MKTILLVTLLLPISSLMLLAESLKIAETIIFKVPEGWDHTDSSTTQIPDRGKLTAVKLENAATKQTLKVSVFKVEDPIPSVQYSTELIEQTLAPWIQAARDQGLHPNPGRSLARGNFIFYTQELGYPNAKKLELRGVLMQKGDDWVNFFCTGPEKVSWAQYNELIVGTKLLNKAHE